MVDCPSFCDALLAADVGFFTGVPDSLLKCFCAYLSSSLSADRHLPAANEGGAIALAAGHYLATGTPALVYMQNSGQGNAVNPLTSLADPAVYGIPMLLVIGWRGEPGKKDEPQHVKQGAITPALCDTLDIPYRLLPQETDAAIACVNELLELSKKESRPVALIVQAGTFAEFKASSTGSSSLAYPSREETIARAVEQLPPDAAIVATTGHISRELYEYRASAGQPHSHDFLTVGSMGHASQIALAIALAKPEKPVVCLDGDGALLMHLGGLSVIGGAAPKNFLHLLLNNGVHGSVGGQPTCGFHIDVPAIALASGYASAIRVESPEELKEAIACIDFATGPHLIEARVGKTARKDLGRPTTTPAENKTAFMDFLRTP